MWKCPKCGEELGDQFSECWNCDSVAKKDESIQQYINPEMNRVKCPGCGSPDIKKRFFGKKHKGVSIFLTILSIFFVIRSFSFSSSGSISLGTLMLFSIGLAMLLYGISGIIGKYKCKECGNFY